MLNVRFKKCLATFAMLAVATGSASAQPGVSDPSHGREIANSLCSSCHEIEPGSQPALKTDVPSFSSIANRPGQTEERLAGAIILSPHPEMPKAALTTRELRDIISYLMSLRAKD